MISCVEPTFCTLSLLSVTSEGNITDKFSPAAYRIPGEGLELIFGMKTCKYSLQRWLTRPWFKPVPPKVGSEAKSLRKTIGVCFWPLVSLLALQGKTFRHPWFEHFGQTRKDMGRELPIPIALQPQIYNLKYSTFTSLFFFFFF